MRSKRRPPDCARVRRAANIVAYWRDGSLVLENYRRGTRVNAAPATVELLALLDHWRRPAALIADLAGYHPRSVTQALARLVRSRIVECEERPADARQHARIEAAWAAWHPEPGLLHFSSKDLTYEALGESHRTLRALARRVRRPPAIKRYPAAARIALPAPQDGGEFPSVLLERRTWRRFSSRPVPLQSLSTLLGLSSRVQHWVELPGVGRLPMKTYPSGGSLHPLEVYLLARRIDGLAPGLYHYAADAHTLELLRPGATAKQLASYLPSQAWYGSASALMIITAVFPRMQWKYKFSRAYRAVLAEAGHLCQNLCLSATWLGLAPFCSLAIADSLIERDIGIDGITESVLYVAGVGTRPSGVDWAPWPTARRLVRTANRP